VNKKSMLWVFVALAALLSAGCSTDNTSGQGQGDAAKPLPQVRVEALPSATASLPPPTAVVTPSLEPSATSAQVYFDPPPDSDAIANQIDALMDEIDRKLKSENFIFK
jgi:hypothetical protein